MMDYTNKSTIEEIENRFDNDVERFSNLVTGQQATIDAPLAMDLITQAAVATTPAMRRILDVGCGAGNNTLKLLQLVSPLDCDLLDLSQPMLDRARQRVSAVNSGRVRTIKADIRNAKLESNIYDVVIAAAVLHHLRDESDWRLLFRKLYHHIAPGGSLWITDLVFHEIPAVQDLMWGRYANYLREVGGPDYQEKVFGYIAKEDSPRPATFQLDLLREVGFSKVDLLHKNSCFAAFGALK
ncbi:MAG: methyltransferase domain-containing protein [Candidatus Promineifilaceae bacterium]|nr:methyltransferase domain-containing protein [Candidatus Promineifilaceae bacterium]